MNPSYDFSDIAQKYGFSGVTYETGNYTKQGFAPASENYSGLRISFEKSTTLKDGGTASSEINYPIDAREAAAIADRIEHWNIGKHFTPDAQEIAAIAECITRANGWKAFGLDQPNISHLNIKPAIDTVIDQVPIIQNELNNQKEVLSRHVARQVNRELSEHLDKLRSAQNPSEAKAHFQNMTESLGKIIKYGLPLFHGDKDRTIEQLKTISDAVVTTSAQVANTLADGIVSQLTGNESVRQENARLRML